MNEPLNFIPDLSSTDTSRPVPSDNTYLVQLTGCDLAFAKDDQAKPMFKLTWTFLTESRAVANSRGESVIISPGFTLMENVLLYQPEQQPGKNASPDYKIRLAKVSDALHNCELGSRPPDAGDLRTAVGKKAVITTKVKDSAEYGLQCNITKYMPAPAGA